MTTTLPRASRSVVHLPSWSRNRKSRACPGGGVKRTGAPPDDPGPAAQRPPSAPKKTHSTAVATSRRRRATAVSVVSVAVTEHPHGDPSPRPTSQHEPAGCKGLSGIGHLPDAYLTAPVRVLVWCGQGWSPAA